MFGKILPFVQNFSLLELDTHRAPQLTRFPQWQANEKTLFQVLHIENGTLFLQ
jgi:hypothetical protein